MELNGVFIHEHERVDDLNRNGLLLIQNPARFCFGIDAVLLSGFAKVQKGERVLDLCTGTGIVPILLSAKTEGEFFTGLEIDADIVEMARRSVRLNSLEAKVRIDCGDVKHFAGLYPLASFDVITANPPYIKHGGGIRNESYERAAARHEILCTLDDVVLAAVRLLKTGGRFYMVHRPDRLPDVLCGLRAAGLEPKTLRVVHSYITKPPMLILIESIRGGKPFLKMPPPIVIYKDDGTYTEEAFDIYYN